MESPSTGFRISHGRGCIPLLVLLCSTLFHGAAASAGLFDEQTPLAMTLTADFDRIGRQRDKTQQYPAQLVMEGLETSLNLEVRGNNRLKSDNCRFPPLRLDFDKKQVKGTIMASQDRLKLVVQCDDGNRFVDFLRTEFLVYRALNLLTDKSFQVRWVDVTYKESDSGKESVRPGFLIESRKHMEKRLGLSRVDAHRVNPNQLDPTQAALIDLFQFMIGNTDYSILQGEITGEEKEPCCHNARLVGTDNTPPFYPVAYDFDNTGIVDPDYASPNEALKLRSIKKRRFRGLCAHTDQVHQQIEAFKAQRAAIEKVFSDDPILSAKASKSALRYLEGFFDIVDDPKRTKNLITEDCR